MSLLAYCDADRTKSVLARDLALHGTPEERAKRFFCQSPACHARMAFRAAAEVPGGGCACFFALPSAPHTENCSYSHLTAYDPDKHDEKSFDFKNFICYLEQEQKALTQQTAGCGNGTQSKKPLTTLQQVHGMLKNHAPKEWLGGRTVSSMLLDDRSFDEYYAHFNGSHIVEAIVNEGWSFAEGRPAPEGVQLNALEKRERLQYYSKLYLTLRVKGRSIIFSVYFNDTKLFEKMRKQITGGKVDYKAFDKPFVVVAGNWELVPGTNHHYITIVKNRKQIFCF